MNVNEIITNRIIESIKQTNTVPWRKPWLCLGYRNAISKRAYRGVNVLMLGCYGKGAWYLTPKQIFDRKGRIKQGSKAIQVVFYNTTREETDSQGNVTKPKRWFLRYYNVFALEDTEGLNLKLDNGKASPFTPNEIIDKIIAASGATIVNGGDKACYIPSEHVIRVPDKSQFTTPEEYYATVLHELMHWANKEVNTEVKWDSFGSESYSKEELVAEIGANFLASYAQIDTSKFYDNSVAYVKNWLERLANDPKLIVGAASQAQKRFDWLMKRAFPESFTNEAESEGETSEQAIVTA